LQKHCTWVATDEGICHTKFWTCSSLIFNDHKILIQALAANPGEVTVYLNILLCIISDDNLKITEPSSFLNLDLEDSAVFFRLDQIFLVYQLWCLEFPKSTQTIGKPTPHSNGGATKRKRKWREESESSGYTTRRILLVLQPHVIQIPRTKVSNYLQSEMTYRGLYCIRDF